MAIITIPVIKNSTMNWQLVRGDQALEFFDGGAVIMQGTKAVWLLSFPLVTKRIVDTRAWWAALVQLAKLGNQFKATPPGWQQGAGYGGADPLVVGAGQLGLSLDCDGAATSTTVGLAGDPIEVNTEVKVLTQDAVSDGAGLVTFDFEPALRDSPANNAVVDVKTPEITLRLLAPQVGVVGRLPDFFNITIEAIEHFGP